MEIAKELDFAPHYLESKRLMHELYLLLNKREMAEAHELSLRLLTEVKLMTHAIKEQV
jgi:hypothetical protein